MQANRILTCGVTLAAAISLAALSRPATAQNNAPPAKTLLQQQIRQRQSAAETRRQQWLKNRPLVPLRRDLYQQAASLITRAPQPVSLPTAEKISAEESAALIKGMEHREKMPATKVKGGGATASGGIGVNAVNIINTTHTWIPSGPNSVEGANPFDLGPLTVAGRINGIAWDPIRQNVLYAATATGGLWRVTLDYLASGPLPLKLPTDSASKPGVQTLSDGSFPTLLTSCVAVNPRTSRILYVGTGDFDGSWYNGNVGTGIGIMKSVNDGRTWVKVGDRNAAGAIFEGTCVSSIVVDPENPKHIIACAGRGATPGYIWNSFDEGNSWNKAQLVAGGDVPNGDWSKIDFGPLRPNRTRTYFASLIGDGVYRSENAGRTWTKLPVPLIFNLPGRGALNLKVAASKLLSNSDIVYVLDASGQFSNVAIFKSIDRGATWINITGDFAYLTGFDNGLQGAYSTSNLFSATIPVNVFDANLDPIGVFARDSLFGTNTSINTAFGQGVKVGSGLYPNSPDILDAGVNSAWLNLDYDTVDPNQPAFANARGFHHALAQSFENISSGLARLGVGDEGGVFLFEYLASAVDPFEFHDFNSDWAVNLNADINANLVAHPILNADFLLDDVGQTHILTATDNLAFPRGADTLNTDTIRAVDYTSVPNADVPDAVDNGTNIPPPPPIGPPIPTTGWNPNGVPNLAGNLTLPVIPNNNSKTTAFDESDPTGGTQYILGTNGDNWPFTRLYMTTDDWQSGLDITPDRYLTFGFGDPLRDKNNAIWYVFNTIDPHDAATATGWQGDRKQWFGYSAKAAMKVNPDGRLLVGTNRVWRYDPPGNFPNLKGPTTGFIYPNKDRGVWRTVNTTSLSAAGYITAISFARTSAGNIDSNYIFVGTSQGEIWYIWEANKFDPASTTVPPPLTGAWTQLLGSGAGNLPNRPVTDISVNGYKQGANANNQYGDIIVTLGGAPGVPRIWRNTNVYQNSPYVPITGQGSASLPDTPINAVTRDYTDGQTAANVYYVATDLGVFSTIDAGSTWTNATGPLGLPNVRCSAIKILDDGNQKLLMVSTHGRGVWRFNLNGLDDAINTAKPNLQYAFTVNRNGNQLIVNLTISNPNGGPAFNVRLNRGTIQAYNQNFETTSIPVNGNINIGTIGRDQTAVVTLRFSGDPPLYPFTAANIRIAGKYTEPPIPPGTDKDFDNGPGYRTRLP